MTYGMARHSSTSAACYWWMSAGWGCLLWTRLPSSSQRCLMGDISGLNAGHGRVWICSCCRYAWYILAVCGRALSCWNKVTLGCWRMNGNTAGMRISSRYLSPVRLPWIRKFCPIMRSDTRPNHHTRSSPPVMLYYCSISESFAISPIDTNPAIRIWEAKPWFVTEENLIPHPLGPVTVLVCPLYSPLASSIGKNQAHVWSLTS